MKLLHLLPLAIAAQSFVIPDQEIFTNLSPELHGHEVPKYSELLGDLKDTAKNVYDKSKSLLDEAYESTFEKIRKYEDDDFSFLNIFGDDEDKPPHHRPDHPHRPGHGPPHHGHGKPNETIYQLISKSKYTTKLAKLISEDDELIDVLNGTAANYTIFAPTDRAFEKIPDHHPQPSKEAIRAILLYHVSPDFYPAGRVFLTHTIPTLLKLDTLAAEPVPQRLTVKIGHGGLAINFYSHIRAANIFATNGVIHGVDSILVPPPNALDIIGFFPGAFSTLSLALEKTGLGSVINDTDKHNGGTFFAPSNFAFKKLGTKANAFLFSKYGEKFLRALLKYHVVADQTLYSDAFYKATGEESATDRPKGGFFHVDLPTLLKDKSLSIDVGRYGPFIEIKINGFARVVVQDGIARDGVIQTVGNVLIPPKKLPGGESEFWTGDELAVEELKERLSPFVEDEERHDL